MSWWWNLLLAPLSLLGLYGLAYAGSALFMRERTGWLFTSEGTRRLTALGIAGLIGPLLAAVLAVVLAPPGTRTWQQGTVPVLTGYLLSLGSLLLWWYKLNALPGWSDGLQVFLAEWARLGLGEPPVVEVEWGSRLVRLRFPDATSLEGDARRLLDQLRQELAPAFTLVIWVGGGSL